MLGLPIRVKVRKYKAEQLPGKMLSEGKATFRM